MAMFIVITTSGTAYGDLFGGDVAILLKILSENVKQYYQLQQLIKNGNDEMNFLRILNQGIDNSIGLLESLPIKDDKILSDLKEFKSAVQKVEGLYGAIPKSPESALQLLHDQTVAESLRMANSFKEYSEVQEKNSRLIAAQARIASPKGAVRMQAETSAEILRSLSQLIRLNTQILKLQSEHLAMNNKNSKQDVANFQKVNRDLGRGFSKFKPDMKLVTF
ncbi:MAG: hypothetical protein A4S09_13450 [Proteobacteria bacterium SG_bin7]|nr:MAG: hypothetical protein A4S09_13450 [Proteobacteria bacterium SG_bin7]